MRCLGGLRDVLIAIEARCSVTETVDRGDRRSQLRRRPRCRGLGPRRGREARRGRTRLRRKRERNKSSNPPAGIFRLARKIPFHFDLVQAVEEGVNFGGDFRGAFFAVNVFLVCCVKFSCDAAAEFRLARKYEQKLQWRIRARQKCAFL